MADSKQVEERVVQFTAATFLSDVVIRFGFDVLDSQFFGSSKLSADQRAEMS